MSRRDADQPHSVPVERAGQGRSTELIHAGVRPGPEGSVVTPISVSTTFAAPGAGSVGEFEYARTQNPSRKSLEEALSVAEGARYGAAFASGLASIDAVCRLVAPGGRVIVGTDAYGGTWRLLSRVWAAHGVEVASCDLTDPGALDRAWSDEVAFALAETPSNPALQICDIAALAEVAHDRGGRLVVDNTFATPWLQRPLSLGADVVVHSTTKYVGGHSDVVGGFVATDDEEIAGHLAFVQNAVGAVPGPFDCFLATRGLRTLGVRMERHCSSAEVVARYLEGHPLVASVSWPGLESHPGHAVAARQMSGFGGMVSFTLAAGEDAAVRVAESCELFTLAESLGAVESLIEHPGRMTHAAAVGSPLAVDPALVRLSIGLEDPEDLVADLERALGTAHRP